MTTSWMTGLIATLGTISAGFGATRLETNASVLVYDYADLPDGSLIEMESVSSLLLARAGIRIHWVHCLGHQAGPQPHICGEDSDPAELIIRILRNHHGERNALGEPLASASVDNAFASLYLSEVSKYAGRNGLSAGTLLAYAATHEIGHLLLGRNHMSSGILRAAWGKAEYREMAQLRLDFGPGERQSLRQALIGRSSLLAAQK